MRHPPARILALMAALLLPLINPGTTRAGAADPDALVDALLLAIGGRDLLAYETTLDDDFLYYFAAEDADRAPGGSGVWDRAAELEATDAIFSGQPGQDPTGEPLPPVASIAVVAHPLGPDWSDGTEAGPQFAGTLRRRFRIDFEIVYSPSTLATFVSTEHELFVIQRGEQWWLFAWRESRPLLRSTVDGSTWGAVKLGYPDIVGIEGETWSGLKSRW